MGLELYMVGVIVEDMPRAVEFYRRLGVDVPADSETKQHVEVKMSGLTFFLSTHRLNARWDPAKTEPAAGGYKMILEFYLKTREELDAKYAQMIGYGYQSHQPPFVTPFNMYFCFINDPDGNTILLSSEVGA